MPKNRENKVYNDLEDDLIRLNNFANGVGWWSRLIGNPTPELRSAVEAIYRSICTASAHIEFANPSNREKMIGMLRKAEKKLFVVLKDYKKLNRWGWNVKESLKNYKNV